MSKRALIELRDLSKSYVMESETVHALRDLNLSIAKNEYVALTGPSGSGKSTLMNILGCLDRPSSGEYWLKGRRVGGLTDAQLAEERNREIGFVFQSFNLLPRADALHNVMQPLIYRQVRLRERREVASEALNRVGLHDRMGHRPNQLSGGQRQRVAIARALVGRPSILLADEPTGNLDSGTSQEIMALFDELHGEGHTIVVVTHEPDIAKRCRRTIRLLDGRLASDLGEAA